MRQVTFQHTLFSTLFSVYRYRRCLSFHQFYAAGAKSAFELRFKHPVLFCTCKGHFCGDPVNGEDVSNTIITGFDVELLRGRVPVKGEESEDYL